MALRPAALLRCGLLGLLTFAAPLLHLLLALLSTVACHTVLPAATAACRLLLALSLLVLLLLLCSMWHCHLWPRAGRQGKGPSECWVLACHILWHCMQAHHQVGHRAVEAGIAAPGVPGHRLPLWVSAPRHLRQVPKQQGH